MVIAVSPPLLAHNEFTALIWSAGFAIATDVLRGSMK